MCGKPGPREPRSATSQPVVVQMDVIVRRFGFVGLGAPELTANLESVDGFVRANCAVLGPGETPTDVTLYVPEGFGVEIVDSNGDIGVDNVGALVIADYAGDVEVSVVQGDVTIDDGPGDVLIEDVDGDVDIVDGPGEIVLRHVSGLAKIDDGRGDIILEDVAEVEIVEAGSGAVIRD